MILDLLLEGFLEESVAIRIFKHCGHSVGNVYGKKGCDYLHKKLVSFYHVALKGYPIFVLTDLIDTGCPCPSEAIIKITDGAIKVSSSFFTLRFAVYELESWILADRKGIAKYLGVPKSKIPSQPDLLINPKLQLVNIARKSKKKIIRDRLVPTVNHAGIVGQDYKACMEEFILKHWDIYSAAEESNSLARCLYKLSSL